MSLSDDLHIALRPLVFRAFTPTAELRKIVDEHLTLVRQASIDNPLLNLDTANQVARECHALLDQRDDMPPAAQQWVAAACRYFAEHEDGKDDFGDPEGFDDDLAVVRWVAAHIQDPELHNR